MNGGFDGPSCDARADKSLCREYVGSVYASVRLASVSARDRAATKSAPSRRANRGRFRTRLLRPTEIVELR